MKITNVQFKILYALGILLIVAGHYGNGGINLFFDWFKPYAFHVGLFVFCSGYFYKEENEQNTIKYIFKQFRKLILPLYLWNLFYGILVQLLNNVGFDYEGTINIYTLFIAPITDGHQFGFNLASWFIVPLFMVQIFVVLARKLLRKLGIKNEWIPFLLFTLLGIAGTQLAVTGYHSGGWLIICRFCYFLPFYAMGRLYNQVLENKLDQIKNTVYFTCIFIMQAVVMILYQGAFAYTPSKCDNFDNCIMPFIIGFLGISFWLRIAKILVPVFVESKLLYWIADNTYSIMMHHFLGLFLLKLPFALLHHLDIACRSFEPKYFKTMVDYYYIPFGIQPFGLFMVVGSIIFSILFGRSAEKLFHNLFHNFHPFQMSSK